MQPFCIDARVLGTRQHLVFNDDSFSWVNDVPNDVWHFSGKLKNNSACCLDTALKLSEVVVDTSPDKKFVGAMKSVIKSVREDDALWPPPWQFVMPKEEHRGFVKRLVNDLQGSMDRANLDYYKRVWSPGTAVLKSMQRSAIDAGRWMHLMHEGKGNIRALASFEPMSDGLSALPVYNRFGTRTGRLTILSGPQMLTLNRNFRGILTSIYGNEGCIAYADFSALEARIMLYESGRLCEVPDLYAMIAEELGDVTRDAVKAAVISELYGSSQWTLSEALGIKGKKLHDFIERVKMYFNVSDLVKRIKRDFVKTGHVVNRYGRHVVLEEPREHLMLNSYAQSTGVDVAMLGFHKMIELLRSRDSNIRPLFILHDGIFFDIKKNSLSAFEGLSPLRINGYVQSWPFKVTFH